LNPGIEIFLELPDRPGEASIANGIHKVVPVVRAHGIPAGLQQHQKHGHFMPGQRLTVGHLPAAMKVCGPEASRRLVLV
jgi:hypothetical protein